MKRAVKQAIRAAVMLVLVAGVSAQESRKASEAAVAGTWDMNAMTHQFALVVDEIKDAKKVTATLMIMGQDVLLDGDVTDGLLTLSGKSMLGAPGSSEMVPLKITGRLISDDKMEGEIGTARGPAKWTAERLKKKS